MQLEPEPAAAQNNINTAGCSQHEVSMKTHNCTSMIGLSSSIHVDRVHKRMSHLELLGEVSTGRQVPAARHALLQARLQRRHHLLQLAAVLQRTTALRLQLALLLQRLALVGLQQLVKLCVDTLQVSRLQQDSS